MTIERLKKFATDGGTLVLNYRAATSAKGWSDERSLGPLGVAVLVLRSLGDVKNSSGKRELEM